MPSIAIHAPGPTVESAAPAAVPKAAAPDKPFKTHLEAMGGHPSVGMKHDGVWPGAAADGTGIGDVLVDTLNPLQHLPVVGSLYRGATGDGMSAAAGVIGGAIFGGPVGLLAGLASAIFSETTGSSIEQRAIAALSDGGADSEAGRGKA